MSEGFRERLERLVREVRALPAAERPAFISRVAGDDRRLREQLERWLEGHGADAPAPSPEEATTAASAGDAPEPRRHVGRYRILQEIGSGGFGTVYMAEQSEPFRRRVALKILHPGMNSREVVARFEAERQALALMDHPHIATVFDAGTTDDARPFFVMELIQGVPITTYCDQNRLTPEARIELFVTVCSAVQHAHQKGVIHRDLKPGNVLVTLRDGSPVTKVIDFGIAKAMHQPLTDRTLFTRFGHFIGTPAYMSPEQAGMSELDVDTRADVYSLGVMLYELLTGQPPFDPERLRLAGLAGMHRILSEEEPVPLSTRASAADGAIAERRSSGVAAMSRLFRGDLDRVVLKALEKDRTRRYDSVDAFAADLRRWLNHDPVEAAPPDLAARAAKLMRRHRGAVFASAAVAGALVIGLALALIGFVEARRQRDVAIREAARARHVLELTRELLSPADRHSSKPPNVTLRQVLDGFAERLEGRDLGDPEVEATLRATMGNAYKTLGTLDASEVQLARALALRRETFGDGDPRSVESLADWAWLRHDRGAYAEAESLFRAALALASAAPDRDDALVAELEHSLGDALRHLDRVDEAEGHVAHALILRRRLWGEEHERTAASLMELGTLARMRGNSARAEFLTRMALTVKRRTLPAGDPEIATALNNLAFALHDLDRLDEAEAAYREARAIRIAAFGPQSAIVGATSASLALLLQQKGRLAEALPLADEALRIERETRAPGHPSIARAASVLALVYLELGRPRDAEPLLRESLAIRTVTTPGHWLRFDTMARLGEAVAAQRRHAEAESLLIAGFAGLEHDPQLHARAARAAARLSDLYASWKRPADAAAWASRATALEAQP